MIEQGRLFGQDQAPAQQMPTGHESGEVGRFEQQVDALINFYRHRRRKAQDMDREEIVYSWLNKGSFHGGMRHAVAQ